MEFGLGLLGYRGCWDDAAFAEHHGFATAGFVDSPLLGGDPMVCLGLAAQATTTMRLGTFLAVPSNRSAATTTAALATVNLLAPGRVFMGLGTGYTSRNVLGLRPLSAATMQRYAEECRALLDGREVGNSDDGGTPPYRFVHKAGLYVNTRAPIPIYLAGDGPKALTAVGAAGDGWISTMQYSHMMTTSPQVFAAGRAAVVEAAVAADRAAAAPYSMLSTGICLLEEGEPADSPRALELVGAVAMLPFHSYADNPGIAAHLPPVIQDRLESYERNVLAKLPGDPRARHQESHRGHLSHLQPGEETVLTDEVVRMTTLTGTPEEVASTLRRLQDEGLSNVSTWIPPHLTRPTVVDIAERLMSLLT